jgi:hypothetical protein
MNTPVTDFKRQPSRQHAVFLAAVVFVAVLSVFTSRLPMLMMFLLAFAVLGYGVNVYHRVVRLGGANSILALSHDKGRIWCLTTPQGVVKAEMRPSVVVTPWVSVLSFKALDGVFYNGMLFPDSLAAGQYRQFLTMF